MRKASIAILVAAVALCLNTSTAHAASLRVQPLAYNETLATNEAKKGFIDISNPTGQSVQLVTSVQAFRQIDDNGSVEFYESAALKEGIKLDLAEFELGPREAIRMYFIADGTKLPKGDIFAAIFVSTKENQESKGVAQQVRLGTIISLVNGESGPRNAIIENLEVSWLQYGQRIVGTYTVKNTSDSKNVSGFYPPVDITLAPFNEQRPIKGSLVMAGRSREEGFSVGENRFGFYKVTAAYQESKLSRWVFVVTGFWQWLAPLLVALSTVTAFIFWRRIRSRKHYYRAV